MLTPATKNRRQWALPAKSLWVWGPSYAWLWLGWLQNGASLAESAHLQGSDLGPKDKLRQLSHTRHVFDRIIRLGNWWGKKIQKFYYLWIWISKKEGTNDDTLLARWKIVHKRMTIVKNGHTLRVPNWWTAITLKQDLYFFPCLYCSGCLTQS